MTVRFVIIGGGPAGNTAATHAARLGAEVTLIERDIVGGAAHLWDCIPSKTMIATGGAMSFARRLGGMGLEAVSVEVDPAGLKDRVDGIVSRLNRSHHQPAGQPAGAPAEGHGPLRRPARDRGRRRSTAPR